MTIDGEHLLFVCVDCPQQYDYLSPDRTGSSLLRCAECEAALVERARLESTPIAEEEL